MFPITRMCKYKPFVFYFRAFYPKSCYDPNNVKGNIVTSKLTLPSTLHTASIYNVPGALHYSLRLTWTQLQGPRNNFTELVWLLSR